MMGGYCWMLYRDDLTHVYKHKRYAKHFYVFILELVLIAVLSGARSKTNILP